MTVVEAVRRVWHGDQTCRNDGCDRWAGPHNILCPACRGVTPTTHRASRKENH